MLIVVGLLFSFAPVVFALGAGLVLIAGFLLARGVDRDAETESQSGSEAPSWWRKHWWQ